MGKLGVLGAAAFSALAITAAPENSQARLNSEAQIEPSVDPDSIKVQPGECPPGAMGLHLTCNQGEHGSVNSRIDLKRLTTREAVKEGMSNN